MRLTLTIVPAAVDGREHEVGAAGRCSSIAGSCSRSLVVSASSVTIMLVALAAVESRVEAGAERCARALVLRQPNELDGQRPAVVLDEQVGAVLRAVVDDDHPAARRQRPAVSLQVGEEARQVVHLVERRDDEQDRPRRAVPRATRRLLCANPPIKWNADCRHASALTSLI